MVKISFEWIFVVFSEGMTTGSSSVMGGRAEDRGIDVSRFVGGAELPIRADLVKYSPSARESADGNPGEVPLKGQP